MMTIVNSVIHRIRRSHRAAALALAIGGIPLGLTGCGPKGQSGTMTTALSEYNAQHYAAAHDQAAAVMARTTGPQRERAAYVAGLSAYQMGNFDAAEQELSVAAGSSDAATAGNARVMLGQLRLDQHRPREAATSFAEASRMLSGEDARQAAWHAGLAYREAGDENSAKRWLDTASSSQFDGPALAKGGGTGPQGATKGSSLPSPSAAVAANNTAPSITAAHVAPVGFTLQVGAFTDKKRATRAAEEAEDMAKKQSLGRVRIIPRKDARNQPMYLVQIGWWVTRGEATAARAKIGRLEYIVAPAAPMS